MLIITGDGPPLILIPGIQGRHEWMRPAVRALARTHQVLTFSLEPSDGSFDPWLEQIDDAIARVPSSRAAIVGVSFGGVIAACYAGRRPDRVSHLVLVSAPSPLWSPDARTSGYLKRPLWSVPAFTAGAIGRLLPEVLAAEPSWPRRLAFLAQHGARVLRFPASPGQMAARVRAWTSADVAADCARIAAPTLLITGDPRLDRVVPWTSSREYLSLIRHAKHATLERTGHIGLITRPDAFARLIDAFVGGESPQERASRVTMKVCDSI